MSQLATAPRHPVSPAAPQREKSNLESRYGFLRRTVNLTQSLGDHARWVASLVFEVFSGHENSRRIPQVQRIKRTVERLEGRTAVAKSRKGEETRIALKRDDLENILRPLSVAEYSTLLQSDKRDIRNFIEHCWKRRLTDGSIKLSGSAQTVRLQAEELTNNLVFDYDDIPGQASRELVEKLLMRIAVDEIKARTINAWYEFKRSREYSDLRLKRGTIQEASDQLWRRLSATYEGLGEESWRKFISSIVAEQVRLSP